MNQIDPSRHEHASSPTAAMRWLHALERFGNWLPDPAVIFLIALVITGILSAVLAPVAFESTDPRTVVRNDAGQIVSAAPIRVVNLLSPEKLTLFLTRLVKNFTEFPPLGVVLVAMMGVGVAEQSGFIHVAVRYLLQATPRICLTPMLALAAVLSHSAGDVGYVLVIPLGGAIFAAAGRHPLAGIAAAFAGVSGGFSATFLPSSLDPLLQGFTQAAAQLLDPHRTVNPLCNWYFMAASSIFIVGAIWFLTDRIVEPRLRNIGWTTDTAGVVPFDHISRSERRGFRAGLLALGLLSIALLAAVLPSESPFRGPDGNLHTHGAPLMDALVPLIALFFFVPGLVYGYCAGTLRNHRDVIQGTARVMGSMGYYLVLAFCAAQFTWAFRESNLGALTAIQGALWLQQSGLPAPVTIVGVILLSAGVNLLVGSASAKWAILAPILVPMLMQLGLSPELTQAAYRIGDSSTNIVTPLLPYFPLIVVYCHRYVTSVGAGTLLITMAPYAVVFLTFWTALLLFWWGLDLPLGLQAGYRP
ncbi:MAG: AbgT family transporter [Verrucomicrobiota bacterium]|nr:AbgT family transporter [Limisphaera sp.]MDW8380558.1 AbgT family transporter [Verrucomicrobiota bacterium]